ncbi:MAG: hypothetical protein H6707_16335 [Deltaproteobacteria bacterium]|nr:hypothetical protein [Deltaproteobacteria bacterium]
MGLFFRLRTSEMKHETLRMIVEREAKQPGDDGCYNFEDNPATLVLADAGSIYPLSDVSRITLRPDVLICEGAKTRTYLAYEIVMAFQLGRRSGGSGFL